MQWSINGDNMIGCEHSPTAFSCIIICLFDAFNGKIRFVYGVG